MIQVNLLPDIKLEFMRAARTKRLVIAIASIVTVISVIIMIVLLVTVLVFQRKYINDLTHDITKYGADISGTTDINKILTVQNQLNSLTALHEQKPDITKLLPDIKQLTPADLSISSATFDLVNGTATITGSADSLATVNKFADTLKFTTYTSEGGSDKAFSSVVMSSFSASQEGMTYTLTFSFDPTIIFSNTKEVQLYVPDGMITTRSEIDKPQALFQK
jgi:hypothetical protein